MGLLDVLNGMQQGPRGPSNPSAERSYEAVGFRRVGDFGLVCF